MRSVPPAVLALALLGPATLALPPPALTPPLPSNASVLPLNAVGNGGFEAGLAGWLPYGNPGHALPVVEPGAAGSGKAFAAVNEYLGGGLFQPITPTAEVGANLLLDFYAKVASSPAHTSNNELWAAANWDQSTGAADLTALVSFQAQRVRFAVWEGALLELAAPTDGAWHHYQALMLGPAGLGLLLIDGLPARDGAGNIALAMGNPASVDPANLVLLGDTVWCDCYLGPAPDVLYDEIYLGPQG